MNDFLTVVQKINNLVHVNEVMEFLGQPISTSSPDQTVYSCPWHSDSTPSFHVNNDRNVFNCFGCSKSGSTYGLVKYHLLFNNENKKISFNEIKTFLIQINPKVQSVQWVVNYLTDSSINASKKEDFKSILDTTRVSKIIRINNQEEKARFISGIMRGFEDDILEIYVKGNKKSVNLFSYLLGDEE